MRLFRVSDDQNELSSSLFVAFREDEEAVIRDQKLETEKRPRTHIVARCRGHGCIWRCVNPCFDAPSSSMHTFFLCFENITDTTFNTTAIFPCDLLCPVKHDLVHECILDNWKCNRCIYHRNCYLRYLRRIEGSLFVENFQFCTLLRVNIFLQIILCLKRDSRKRPCCFHSVNLCLERRNTIFSSLSLFIWCAIIQVIRIVSSWVVQTYMNFARQWTLPWK